MINIDENIIKLWMKLHQASIVVIIVFCKWITSIDVKSLGNSIPWVDRFMPSHVNWLIETCPYKVKRKYKVIIAYFS